MARLNSASSRVFLVICKRMRMAQISFNFKGDFWPINLPLFQGACRLHILAQVEHSFWRNLNTYSESR